ncbi:MAG TPA: hypothetical protein HA362_04345 [Nanoarchaeota archaeon]|nr:hypothetical protein [Nanoarchaeota archaeon]
MRTLAELACIASLGLAAGCGDDTYIPADADTTEETAAGFTFEGKAAYCVSHRDEMSTCVHPYADLLIWGGNGVSKAWANAYRDGEAPVKISERAADGNPMHYAIDTDLCIRGSVNGVGITAEDSEGGQGAYPVEEVDCETLDAMIAGP